MGDKRLPDRVFKPHQRILGQGCEPVINASWRLMPFSFGDRLYGS
jgi:hypothetical protein